MPNSSLPDPSPDALRLHAAFFPYAFRRQYDAVRRKQRFAHYTSAEAALAILRSNAVLLRNARCLPDFKEMRSGIDSVVDAWSGEEGQRLQALLNRAHPGVSENFIAAFQEWSRAFSRTTYIFSVSEHDDAEDNSGRSSSWQAVDARVKVALILKQAPFFQVSDSAQLLMSPITYSNASSYTLRMKHLVDHLESHFSILENMARDELLAWSYAALKHAAISSKPLRHNEDREWRIVFTELGPPVRGLLQDVMAFEGVPQKTYKLPLTRNPEQSPHETTLPQTIDRIVIGPNEYPDTVYDAFVSLLAEYGVEDAESRVTVSYTALR